ncbi:MAG: S9 family peptidase [Saprospiraceae bacterium]|nr:S9 family peptidase [Saprospiraceae bacterium]
MKYFLITFCLFLGKTSVSGQSSINDLLSPPFPTSLTGSADGSTIAWVFNERGQRNIYIAFSPDFKAQKLTSYQGDEGIELVNLQLSKDGKKLLFIRGNSVNSKGEPANPAQLQTATDRNIWIAETTLDSLRKIGPGSSPRFSEDGRQFIYINKGEVWHCLSDKNQAGEKLFAVRSGVSVVRWSPDASRIAFAANRGNHAFVGTFDIKNKSITYIDPSIDIDAQPAWSPDGSKLAFMRIPYGFENLPFTPQREGMPWSIRVHDFISGKTNEVWMAKPGRGSVPLDDLPVTDNKLKWTSGNQLIFPWEVSGWQQLYALDIVTGKVKLLTPGAGEIENAEMSTDLTSLYYTTNLGDTDRRHIWNYNFATGTNKQLTSGNIEWSPIPTKKGLVCLYSTSKKPAWPAIVSADGKPTDLAQNLFPATFNSAGLVEPMSIQITATDGMMTPAQIFLPKSNKTGEKHPAIIFIHGGSRRQMLLGFNYSQYYSNAYALNQYFASKGYVVIALNYRSGIGYGLDFREALNYGATGGSEFFDVLGAGLYLKNRADVDASKIALWGGSYGGYLTAMGLSRASDIFACGVDIHGVHDWNEGIRNFVPTYVPEKTPDFKSLAFRSSPESSVDGWKSPVLFIHGDDDRNVNFTETVRMANLLRERNVYFEQLVFPDEIHGFLLYRSWVNAYEATYDFIDRMMMKK